MLGADTEIRTGMRVLMLISINSWVICSARLRSFSSPPCRALQAAAKRTVERSLAFEHPSRPSLFSLLLHNERQISDVQISKFQIQLSAPPTTKARESSGPQLRNGLLVRIVLRSGAVGTGEIAPLEGLHAESLEKAEEQMSALKDALIGRSLPGTLPLLGGAIATWLKEGAGINVRLLAFDLIEELKESAVPVLMLQQLSPNWTL
jgi:hypothetical protein